MSVIRQPRIKVPSFFAGKAWQQVLARDVAADGQFVYAVKTTKIFCRPSCPSRRPDRKNVSFYPTPEQALSAGYRACLVCEPELAVPKADPQQAAIEAVSSFLTEHSDDRTRLKDVSKATGIAPLTILRGFKRVLGVTPRAFAKAQRVERTREKARAPKQPGKALDNAGLSLQSDERADMTASTLKAGGKGELIRYALAASPLGPMLVAATARGICSVSFADFEDELLDALRETFPQAQLRQMDRELSYAVEAVLAGMREDSSAALPVDVRATAFQQRVWRELQGIPRGETRTYTQLAEALGSPRSVRAVAAACAANPLAVLVPCHRVVGKSGALTGYRWGVERKRRLLEAETARP